jgi:hypothetical protein
MYDRVIRLRGRETYELAARTRLGYELDPSRNFGIKLVVRAYVVAEDYSVEEFIALVKSESEQRAEAQRFRATFALDSRDLDQPPPVATPPTSSTPEKTPP